MRGRSGDDLSGDDRGPMVLLQQVDDEGVAGDVAADVLVAVHGIRRRSASRLNLRGTRLGATPLPQRSTSGTRVWCLVHGIAIFGGLEYAASACRVSGGTVIGPLLGGLFLEAFMD